MRRPSSESSLSAPAPIIKTRIPIELKTVFLAAQRGEQVTEAPPCASKIFDKWQGAKTTKSVSSDAESADAAMATNCNKKNRQLVFGDKEQATSCTKSTLLPAKPKQCRWSSEVNKAVSSVDPPRHVSPLSMRRTYTQQSSLQDVPFKPLRRATSPGRWDLVGRNQSSDRPKLPGRKRSSQNVMDVLEVHPAQQQRSLIA